MGELGGPGAPRGTPSDPQLSLQGCKESVQTWLAGNLVTIVGVCIGIGLGEVGRMPWGWGAEMGVLGVVGRLWDPGLGGLDSSWVCQGGFRGWSLGSQGVGGGSGWPEGSVGGEFRVAGSGVRDPRGSGKADPALCSQLCLVMLSMFLLRNLDSHYEKLLRGL